MKAIQTKNLLCSIALVAAVGATACESTSGRRYPAEKQTTTQKSTTSSANDQKATTTTAAAPKKRSTTSASAASGDAASSLAFPTGDPATSTILLEKFAPREVQAGSELAYEIQVTNLTAMSLENVVVNEDFSKNFVLGNTTPKSASSQAGIGQWNLGTMGPRESKTIRVIGSVKDANAVSTCSSVAYNAGLCMSVPVVEPKLRLTAAAPGEISICDDMVAEYVVTNTGSGAARDVIVKGAFPEGMTTTAGLRNFEKNVGTLEAGKSRKFAIPAKVAREGSFQFEATASAQGGLTAMADRLTTTVRRPMLKLTKTGPTKSFAGRPLRYELTLKNEGDGIAEATVLEDSIPSGTKVKSASAGAKMASGKVRWNVGTLAPGEAKTFRVELTTDKLGSYSGLATAKATCADAVQASASTTVAGIPAILLEVIDEEDPIEVGANVTYSISITNQGTAADGEIRIDCVLPNNVSFVSADGPTKATTTGQNVKFAPVPTLPPKKTVVWKLTVKGNSGADSRFKVIMNSRELTSPVEETEATYFYE